MIKAADEEGAAMTRGRMGEGGMAPMKGVATKGIGWENDGEGQAMGVDEKK